MHIQIINFLKKNEILFSYQFGFQKNYSTNYCLISLTEMTRNIHDNDNFACGIFIEMQIDFGTVSYYILFSKVNHYGFTEVAFGSKAISVTKLSILLSIIKELKSKL